MNIIVRNTDGAVLYAGSDVALTAVCASGFGWADSSLNTSNASLVTNQMLPIGWVPGVWNYINGTWGIADTAAYNKIQQGLTVNQAQSTFQALIANGIILTSTGTPALNGTYSTTDTAQKNVSSVVTGIAAGLGLPGGGTTFQYLDAANIPHAFDTSHFTAFAAALRNFVYNCEITLATIQNGGTATFPSNLVTIA